MGRGNGPQAELGVQVSANQCCPKEELAVHAHTHQKQVPRLEQEAGGDGEGRPRTRDVLGVEEQEAGLGRRHFRGRRRPASENFREAKHVPTPDSLIAYFQVGKRVLSGGRNR